MEDINHLALRDVQSVVRVMGVAGEVLGEEGPVVGMNENV